MPTTLTETTRVEIECESAALCVPVSVKLEPQSLLDAFAATFSAAGEVLQRVSVRRADGSKFTLSLGKARERLRLDADFTSLHAIPKSELQGANWLCAGMVFAESQFSRTIYFGRPRSGTAVSFSPHTTLGRELVRQFEPSYGFGYYRRYGLGPALFATGISLNAGKYGSTQYDSDLITTWAAETQGDPRLHPRSYRHERGMLLDVFPINLLSPKHLQQRVGDVSLQQWIQSFSDESNVIELDKGFAVWTVPMQSIASARKALQEAHLIIPLHGSSPVVQ